MYRIIYLSSAKKLMSELELDTLLKTSRSNNKKQGITGLLLYFEGDFMQVIEGEEQNVRNLFQNILQDNRHSNIICVFSKNVDGREFSDWSMNFSASSYADLNKIKEFENINRNFLFKLNDKTILAFLDTFLRYHRILVNH